jgi:hypothetical protein
MGIQGPAPFQAAFWPGPMHHPRLCLCSFDSYTWAISAVVLAMAQYASLGTLGGPSEERTRPAGVA